MLNCDIFIKAQLTSCGYLWQCILVPHLYQVSLTTMYQHIVSIQVQCKNMHLKTIPACNLSCDSSVDQGLLSSHSAFPLVTVLVVGKLSHMIKAECGVLKSTWVRFTSLLNVNNHYTHPNQDFMNVEYCRSPSEGCVKLLFYENMQCIRHKKSSCLLHIITVGPRVYKIKWKDKN